MHSRQSSARMPRSSSSGNALCVADGGRRPSLRGGDVQPAAAQALRTSGPFHASAPAEHLLEKKVATGHQTMDPIVRRMLDRARPVMEFMDEEKEVWGVSRRRRERGRK